MTPEPLLSAPLVSRPRVIPRFVGRATVFTLVAAAYAITAAALILANLLTVESVDPPKAAITPVYIVRQPVGGGGTPALSGPSAGNSRAALATAPRIHPPAPRPVVVPLAPPETTSELSSDAMPGAPGDGSSTGGPTGVGPGGPGPGGPGPDCPGCPGGAGPAGVPSPDDPLFDADRPDVTPPVLIAASRTLPKYPEMARLARVQGSVMLLIVIDRDGRVGAIEVLRSPDPRFGFDLSAIEAVKSWRYRPARYAGRPVSVQASVLIEFSLSR